jgi:hypothetical protein
MIFFIRKLTKNFISEHRFLSINGLPLEITPSVEKIDNPASANLEGYFKNILMCMNEDA